MLPNWTKRRFLKQNKAEEALKGATQKEELEHAQAVLAEAAARYNAVKKLKGKK